ncbi:EamA family transporter [Streptacidiphilus monticola]|uniref:DMT family transporter n=1 Tax=Streptacidiphilus monticola TaxID=2161674 RepID=A0ABW1FU28_9ACTN
MHRRSGLALALLSALSFGGSGVAAKPLIELGLAPVQVVWIRMAGAALVLSPLAWRHRGLVRRRPGLLLGFGLLGVALVQSCYFFAISRIPVAVAMLLEYLGPALLLGYVRFVQRRPVTRAAALGALTATVGLACVVQVWTGLHGLDALGVLGGLGAACSQVGYFVLSEKAGQTHRGEPVDPLALCSFGLLVGCAAMVPFARPWGLPWSRLGGDAVMNGVHLPALVPALWMVLIATVVAYLTGVASVSRLSAPVAGVIACLEAVVATVLSWVLLGEHLAGPQLVGGLLVLGGAFLAQTSRPSPQGSSVVLEVSADRSESYASSPRSGSTS